MKPDTVLYVTEDPGRAREYATVLQDLGSDLLIAAQSLAPAVLFLNRRIDIVVVDEPDPSNLERLIRTLRPELKIVAPNELLQAT